MLLPGEQQYKNQAPAQIEKIFPKRALLHYIDHPVDYVEDVFSIKLDQWQKDVANTVAHPDRGFVAIAAGSGVGKTFLLARLIYWFLTTRRGKVPCTAPTEHQLHDILWSEMSKAYNASPELQQIFTWTQTKVFVNGYVATWYAVARTATIGKDGKVQEGLQGFHDDHLMFVVDEASGVADPSFAAVDGALTAPNAKIIMTSNPTRLSGRFWAAFHVSSRAHGGPWDTWNIDCRDSQFVGDKYVKRMLLEHGEDSPVFKSKVSGDFPAEEDSALISRQDVKAARTGVIPKDRVYTEHDVPSLPPASPIQYSHPLYASEAHEQAATQYFAAVGFKGLIGLRPREGMNMGRFRPPS